MVYRMGRKLFQWDVLFKTHVINGAIHVVLRRIDVKIIYVQRKLTFNRTNTKLRCTLKPTFGPVDTL